MSFHMQEYRPEVWRVWSNGQWVEYDVQSETEAVRIERMWSEATLQAQRRNNTRYAKQAQKRFLMDAALYTHQVCCMPCVCQPGLTSAAIDCPHGVDSGGV